MVNNSTNICKANNQQLRYLKQPTVTLPQTTNSYVTSNNQQLHYLKQTSNTKKTRTLYINFKMASISALRLVISSFSLTVSMVCSLCMLSYSLSKKNQQLRFLKQPTVTLPQTNNSYVTSNNQQSRYLKQTSVTLPQTTNSYVTSNNRMFTLYALVFS
jgi:hypothetical protein